MLFQMGEVTTVLSSKNEIQIRDLYNKSVLTIALNNIPQLQYMPVVGDIVLYINYEDKIYQIIKIWNIKSTNFVRQKEFPLQEGELQLMGTLGQYIHFDKKGTVKFVDSTMLNIFELSVQGLIAKLKKFQLDTYDGINITIDKGISISRKKAGSDDEDEEPIFSANINDEGVEIKNKNVSITIDNNDTIVIKGDNVQLVGNSIQLGDKLLGDIVTAGPLGSWSICPVTGTPIIGSSKCKAEK